MNFKALISSFRKQFTARFPWKLAKYSAAIPSKFMFQNENICSDTHLYFKFIIRKSSYMHCFIKFISNGLKYILIVNYVYNIIM